MSDLNSTTETAVTHTPGPWRYVDGVVVAEQFDKVYMVKREDGSEHPHHDGLTALVYGRHIDGHYTHDANAHLIAAAPDLLACLRRMCGMYGAYSRRLAPLLAEDEGTIWTFERANGLALEAIAKAEGRAS